MMAGVQKPARLFRLDVNLWSLERQAKVAPAPAEAQADSAGLQASVADDAVPASCGTKADEPAAPAPEDAEAPAAPIAPAPPLAPIAHGACQCAVHTLYLFF